MIGQNQLVFTASKPSMWRQQWDVARDGSTVARFEQATFRQRGRFTLEGRDHLVKGLGMGTRYALYAARVDGEATDDGVALAEAERVGRKEWTVSGGGLLLRFRRRSMWRPDQELLDDMGSVVGGIRRTGRWSTAAEAELPGVPDPVAIFCVLVVVMSWEAAAGAAAAGGSAAAT